MLEEEEKDLIWKFRFYLSRDKMALTKFLKSVSWTDPSEVKQAVETLLPMWTDVEMVDALELLGPGFVDGRVRAYAVKQLARAEDEVGRLPPSIDVHDDPALTGFFLLSFSQELLLYLLQLVQALKFEPQAPSDARSTRSSHSASAMAAAAAAALSTDDSGLAEFLIKRSVLNAVLGNSFYWYLMVETEDRSVGKMYAKIVFRYMKKLENVGALTSIHPYIRVVD